jgi:hypothetical protein
MRWHLPCSPRPVDVIRRSLTLLFWTVAGCVSGTGVEGFPDPDGQEVPPPSGTDTDPDGDESDAPCPAESGLDLGASASVGFRELEGAGGVEVIGFDVELADSIGFELYLWHEEVFENGFYPGTFDLILEPFCSACAALDSPDRVLQARSGTVAIAEVSRSRLRGTISDVTMVEVVDRTGRPIAGGCTASLASHDFDVELPIAPVPIDE